MFVAIRLIISEPTRALPSINSLLSTAKLRLLHFTRYCTGWSKKTAQSLWHHNFATVHHRVMRFSAKCSERNSLHD